MWWHSLGLPGVATDRASIKFPFELELLPELLRARILVNSFSMAEEAMTCWTYESNGLKSAGQKEMLVSIKKMPHESTADFPQAPLEFFKTVLQHSVRREFIDIGSISEFGENGFLSKTFTAAAYIRSQPLGDWFPPSETLACILLTREELAASQIAGLARVLALLGKASLRFPCPAWNDLTRVSVVTAEMLAVMTESFIAQMPRIMVRDSGVSTEGQVIDLQLPLSARHYFKQLAELPSDSPLVLLVDFDERADAMLVFQEDKKTVPLAISAPGTQGTRIAGSFICFAPAQKSDHGMIVEDGFALSLEQETWDELRASLINGSPFYLPRQEAGYDFRLSWHQDEAAACGPNTIQISGIDLGCRSGISKVETDDRTTVPAYASALRLLNHEFEIRKLIRPDVFRRYIMHIEDLVRDHFQCMGKTEGFQLTVRCTIAADCKASFEATSNPIMEAQDESDLLDRLSLSYAPCIEGGTVSFQIEFIVWGGQAEGDTQ